MSSNWNTGHRRNSGKALRFAFIFAVLPLSFGCWEQIDDGLWFPQMKRQITVQAFEENTWAGQSQGFSPPEGTVPVGWGAVPDLASLAPAMHVLSKAPASVLRGKGGPSRSASRMRATLVVGQVAASVTLVIATGLFVRALVARTLRREWRVAPAADAPAATSGFVKRRFETADSIDVTASCRSRRGELCVAPGCRSSTA